MKLSDGRVGASTPLEEGKGGIIELFSWLRMLAGAPGQQHYRHRELKYGFLGPIVEIKSWGDRLSTGFCYGLKVILTHAQVQDTLVSNGSCSQC